MADQEHPDTGSQPATPRPRAWVRRLVSGLVRFVLTATVVGGAVWAAAVLSLADLDGRAPRVVVPILFSLVFLSVMIFVRPHRRARLAGVVTVVAVAAWYFSIAPSNERTWAPEYARLATATIEGERVTLHNYRTLDPAPGSVVRYVDETFDLNQLQRADFLMSYWGPTRVAHALVSFEFSDGRYVAASIEVRRRASQQKFNMVSSLFRNFELIYVVGSERALIGSGILDDHHRIFLYRSRITPERSRALFLRYANKLNELAAQPEWYNAITDNCTTGIYFHLREIPPAPPFNINILLNGYLPQYIYEHGNLDTSLPWPELNRLCDIKERGQKAYDSPDFSRRIREGIPIPRASDTRVHPGESSELK